MKRLIVFAALLALVACSPTEESSSSSTADSGDGGTDGGTTASDSGATGDDAGSESTDGSGSGSDNGQSDGTDGTATSGDTGGDDGGDPCWTPQEFFEAKLWPQLLGVKCLVCHSAEGIAKDTNLVFLKPDEAGSMETNFEAAKSVALVDVAGSSLILLKPTNQHPLGHTGGQQLTKNDPEYALLSEFVKRVSGEVDDCEKAPIETGPNCDDIGPGPRQLRRLSRFEYDRTVSDLLNLDSKWGESFTTEKYINGFDNNAQALSVSPLLAEQIRKAAEEIAEQAPIAGLLSCNPAPGQESLCANEFIADFGMRAFRRPMQEKEVTAYKKLFDLVFVDDGFHAAIRFVITAMLQSPHFLYRSELGKHQADGLFVLTAYEIASQLSYLLWGSMPDQALFDAAASGALLEPTEILKQAQRLITADKSNALLAHFSKHWLETHRLPYQAKNEDVFPDLTYEIRQAMMGESARLLSHLIHKDGGNLNELFSAKYSFMNDALAQFYQVAPPSGVKDAAGFGKVELADTHFGGLLTQASITTSHAYPDQSSPIHRGKFVRERLLCQHLPPPPPGIIVNVPAVDPNLSTRDRFAAHSEKEPCNGCHELIDPVGFAFEHYTGEGRYREKDGKFEIDATGYIKNSQATNGVFDGVHELAQKLSKSQDVHTCYALQWMRYGYGVEENDELACLTWNIKKHFLDSGLDVGSLLEQLTQTVHFRYRIGNPDDIIEGSDDGSDDVGTDDVGADDVGTDEGGTDGTGETPFEPQNLQIDAKKDSEWGTGYCSTIKVTNLSDEMLTWKFKLKVDGTINQIWNAATIPIAGSEEIFFVGVAWNGQLAPSASAEFGFCAAL